MTTKPRVKIYPDAPAAGSIAEVKTLINHVMETGNRRAADGTLVKRNIINSFVATFDGKEIFRAELHPGISANPFLGFFMRVPGAGKLELTWHDDEDKKITETLDVKVS
jgi:sulfur-oxidizing protein SoxZ